MSEALLREVEEYKGGRFTITVIRDRCKECGFCINVCPVKILVKSSVENKYGFRPPTVLNPEKCIGCRLCEYMCPEFAIFVTKGEGVEDRVPIR
ncbi:MAG: 4Fe-4S dicluster domain-containing protein [Thermogladius sp.]|jgi:2-oxoglutarate ferredoxin oxidoreductase subunit delta|nr:4Fe-4S dicluster domain-containing protein [Thermogladius sp.]